MSKPNHVETSAAKSKVESPGGVRSENYLALTTYQAINLLTGRPAQKGKQGIVGLWAFADMMSTIWRGAATGDPYADWWLIKVDEVMERATQELGGIRAQLEEAMGEIDGCEFGKPYSEKPVKKPLTFTNNYSFRAARLLGAYDRVVQLIRNARHVGLIDAPTAARLTDKGGKAVRRVFESVTGYKFKGINRDDVTLQTARGMEAQKIMGKVPEDVLSMERRSPWAPDLHASVLRASMMRSAGSPGLLKREQILEIHKRKSSSLNPGGATETAKAPD